MHFFVFYLYFSYIFLIEYWCSDPFVIEFKWFSAKVSISYEKDCEFFFFGWGGFLVFWQEFTWYFLMFLSSNFRWRWFGEQLNVWNFWLVCFRFWLLTSKSWQNLMPECEYLSKVRSNMHSLHMIYLILLWLENINFYSFSDLAWICYVTTSFVYVNFLDLVVHSRKKIHLGEVGAPFASHFLFTQLDWFSLNSISFSVHFFELFHIVSLNNFVWPEFCTSVAENLLFNFIWISVLINSFLVYNAAKASEEFEWPGMSDLWRYCWIDCRRWYLCCLQWMRLSSLPTLLWVWEKRWKSVMSPVQN